MKKLFLRIGMALLIAGMVFPAPLKVSWTEGTVQIKSGSSWKNLDAGASIDSSSIIQLMAESFIEFTYPGGKLALSAEGVYSLDKILANANRQQQERSTVLSKVGKLVANKAPLSTIVAGVRGSEQDSTSNIDWIVDDENSQSKNDIAAEAYAQLQKGAYLQAAGAFAKLVPYAPQDAKTEYLYAQAWCLASANDLVGSIKLLRTMPDVGPFAIERALLLSRLNLDTGAVSEAIQVLESLRLSSELESDNLLLVQDMLNEAKALKSQ